MVSEFHGTVPGTTVVAHVANGQVAARPSAGQAVIAGKAAADSTKTAVVHGQVAGTQCVIDNPA